MQPLIIPCVIKIKKMNTKFNKAGVLMMIPILAMLAVSCEMFNCIDGNGIRSTDHRITPDFYGVISDGEFEGYITIDTSLDNPEVTVKTDENLQPYIETRVRNENLELYTTNNRCLNSNDPITIEISMNSIDYTKLSGSGLIECNDATGNNLRIDLTGSGNIEFYNMDFNSLDVNHSGSGKIELTGYCEESELDLSGSGFIRAYHLEQSTSYIDLSGSGEIVVWAWDLLDINIPGSGTVFYRIRPVNLQVKITGSGEVREFK
jgi:hypothetical protein